MKKHSVWLMLLLVTLACSLPAIKPTAAPLPPAPTFPCSDPSGAGCGGTPTQAVTTAAVSPQPAASPVPPTLAPTDLPSGKAPPSLAVSTLSFSQFPLTAWQGKPFKGQDYKLPLDLDKISNPQVLADLTAEEKKFLSQNGFVVIDSQEEQFCDIRDTVSEKFGQPYYLTADAAFHAAHLTFDETLKALERENLHSTQISLMNSLLNQLVADLPRTKGTPIAQDAELAAAYAGVALKLFDPGAQIDSQINTLIQPQLEQINKGGGQDQSVLIPNFTDDYGAYKPVGHYAGDAALENYFRGMTWLGRVHFKLKDPLDPNFVPSRAPLIITLALRQAAASDSGQIPAQQWSSIYETLGFLIGPTDDPGPLEYSALMDEVYGSRLSPEALADESLWKQFQEKTSSLPAPRINGTFAATSQVMAAEKGWRLMGQRFTLDGFIFQNMVFDKVGDLDNKRVLPSGLDLMAAFGSSPALTALNDARETSYTNYSEQMAKMQEAARTQTENVWLGTTYNVWMYAFLPQVTAKDSNYPVWMRSAPWSFREMNTALGSWTELKHDTVLYTKQPEMMGGGGPPSSPPAPAYVEPNPPVFYRMAYMIKSLVEGLRVRRMDVSLVPPAAGSYTAPDGLEYWLKKVENFGQTLETLGGIAEKELAGEALTEDEKAFPQYCLGPVECQVDYLQTTMRQDQKQPPVALISSVAGGEDKILEAATGKVNRIYVIVPLEGKLEAAQGGVFSYYEFPQPRSNRLTDEEWRNKLESSAPEAPAWTKKFLFSGGSPANVMVFRIGDVYLITPAGADLNLRQTPSVNASIIKRLAAGEYLEVIDGPQVSGRYTWWKVKLTYGEQEGWVVENQEWYERAYGQ